MDVNPYAPPAAYVADREPAVHGLKQHSLVVMLVLAIATFGLYIPVWYIRRRPGLNRLDSPKKLALWPFLLLIANFAVAIGLGFVAGDGRVDQVLGTPLTLGLAVARLSLGILIIVQTFRIKDIIEDHATPADGSTLFVERVSLSGLMTFFFSIFYLQWAINRYVVPSPQPGTIGAGQ
jgi:hypothetical protein